MDLLAAFRCFVRVAETGSFSAVAREVGSTQPAISRQIAALEAHFEVRLIQRTTRSLTFTQDGTDLLAHARRVLDTVDETEEILGKRRASPNGTVRIASSTSMARLQIIPRIPSLLQRYPQLEVEISISEQAQDLVAENLDVAIRAGAIADSSLVARHLGSTGRGVLAATDYLEKHGEPQTPQDLLGHSCLVYTGAFGRNTAHIWEFDGPGGKDDGRGAWALPLRQHRGDQRRHPCRARRQPAAHLDVQRRHRAGAGAAHSKGLAAAARANLRRLPLPPASRAAGAGGD